jgi:thioredoxin reductase (NADPH)
MGTPVLLLVDEDRKALEALAGDVGRRFGVDYQIVAERSPVAALAALEQMGARSQAVAVALAAQRMTEMSGVEFLVAAHELHPAARRVLLVARGDYSAANPAVRAMTVGQIDYHLFTPWLPAERWLYPQLSDVLAAWSKTREPSFAAGRRRRAPPVHQARRLGRRGRYHRRPARPRIPRRAGPMNRAAAPHRRDGSALVAARRRSRRS